MTGVDPLVAAVRDDLAAALADPDLTLRTATRLTAGASRITWMLDVTRASGETEQLVLQRERVRGARLGGVTAESTLLQAAGAAGVPVPAVVASDPVGDSIGGGYVVTRRVEGETIARRILRDDEYAGARSVLASQLGRILAAIHAVPTGDLPLSAQADVLAATEEMLDEACDARPAFELGLQWLREHRPAAGPAALVHGDFRLGNLVVGPEGVRAVLDWELAHVGDPLEDLGWVCSPAWRFGGDQPVAGVGAREELWAAYEEAGGRRIDRDAALWWEVCSTVRWGVMCLLQARTHLSGAFRSAELAALGRRAAECEHDLFAAVFPGPASDPAPPADPPDLYGRPTAAELVAAVRESIGSWEAAPPFQVRVATRALAVVERELLAGIEAEQSHRKRLSSLGFADDAALAAAIRAGEVGVSDDVVAAVRADVAQRIAVYDPSYGR
ncbi:MAG: phosphotransferase [Mycobacteriales bacterium]